MSAGSPLSELNISFSKDSRPEHWPQVIRRLSANPLNISIDCPLSDEQLREFATAASSNGRAGNLQLFKMSQAGLNAENMPIVGHVVKTLSPQRLDLSRNKLTPYGVAALAPHLSELARSERLRFLNLDECELGDDGVRLLFESLGRCTTLRHLSIKGIPFMTVDKGSVILRRSEGELTSAVVAVITEGLKNLPNLEVLCLDDNNIGAGYEAILEVAARYNRRLKVSNDSTSNMEIDGEIPPVLAILNPGLTFTKKKK